MGGECFGVGKGRDQFFSVGQRGDQNFLRMQKGAPEKIGDWPSPADAPPLPEVRQICADQTYGCRGRASDKICAISLTLLNTILYIIEGKYR